ncbi:protein tyrosine phosphatase [Rhodococcus sp. NPDC003318]|uniref:arsenate reductase/protein-tyrosine-phosphatase family protein n=1 Tax=Rhodococcus sp. NPDC003318 TaxID=3364503 RepID=UPI00369EE805
MHLLFVCTGNICRSPTAERLAVAFAEEFGLPGLTAESAGTRAMVGYPMEPTAAMVLESLGGDPAGFTARRLTPEIAMGADLILTMTATQREKVLTLAPAQMKRTFTLREAARLSQVSGATTVAELAAARAALTSPDSEDVADPIGQDAETFLEVGTQVADLLGPVLHQVRG